MSDEPDLNIPSNAHEVDVGLRVTAVEYRVGVAIVLAALAELGVIALALLYALNRRSAA